VREDAETLGPFLRDVEIRNRQNSVTALAIASSRHRLGLLKSSFEIGALRSIASAVTTWHTSP
jgi:hypothetical protein